MIKENSSSLRILIVGFGGMGCRHAQSLLDSNYKNITIIEPNIEIFNSNLKKIGYLENSVKYKPNFENLNERFDFAIVATSAKPRYSIVENLISLGLKKILIEKIAFQSIPQFDRIIELSKKNDVSIYCNFVNRYFYIYSMIANKFNKEDDRLRMTVNAGNLGLSCSAIHYLDLFEFITNSKIDISFSNLQLWEKENKRGKDYREFSGIFVAFDYKHNSLKINFDESHDGLVDILIETNEMSYFISEGSQICSIFDKDGTFVNKKFEIIPTSKLTSTILKDISINETKLPNIEDAKNVHLHLIKECNRSLDLEMEAICPIT